ncbi:MAG: DNA repair protein NreB [Methanonatronarchaeales archaeon]|nr:DNA repair protein NreB [Methanonatronarchaeales archaeon]
MREECIRCKIGKNLCGDTCPYLERIPAPKVEVDTELFGPSPPAVFVGRRGYPRVNVGPMVSLPGTEEPGMLDSTESWFGRSMDEVIGMRASLVRGIVETDVKGRNPFVEIGREVAMASRPVDTEMHFDRRPSPEIRVDGATQPMGPSGRVEEMILAENPRVPRRVEHLVGDTDARASTALSELHGHVPVDHEIRLLSAGLLGRERDRKLVPTRWSITAVDSTLSRDMVDRIRDFRELEAPMLGTARHMDNRFAVLLFPGAWSFEFVESFREGAIWATEPTVIRDWEPHGGRTGYAEVTAGAYYSGRLAAAELLTSLRRQARAIVVREIGPEYIVPLGVWVVREGARSAAENAERVDTLDEGLRRAGGFFRMGRSWEARSPVLREEREQTSLGDF